MEEKRICSTIFCLWDWRAFCSSPFHRRLHFSRRPSHPELSGQEKRAGAGLSPGNEQEGTLRKKRARSYGPDRALLPFPSASSAARPGGPPPSFLLISRKDLILYLLMFSVGISIGLHHGLIRSIRQYHLRIFILPAGVHSRLPSGRRRLRPDHRALRFRGSGCGGRPGLVQPGRRHAGKSDRRTDGKHRLFKQPDAGAFLLFQHPVFIPGKNYYACIAAAGATSEDTTLPLMIRYTSEETVILSVLNGAICSAFVPVLLSLCFWLSGL